VIVSIFSDQRRVLRESDKSPTEQPMEHSAECVISSEKTTKRSNRRHPFRESDKATVKQRRMRRHILRESDKAPVKQRTERHHLLRENDKVASRATDKATNEAV
jgi:hypothetical protein